MKKTCLLLVILSLTTALLHAAQTPVLTEIEKIQEKLWYLQRDVSAQKAALDQQQAELANLSARTGADDQAVSDRLDSLAQSAAGLQERTDNLDAHLQRLEESLTALVDEINRQNATFQTQTEQSTAWQERLTSLEARSATHRSEAEQALEENHRQLEELRAQLQQSVQSQAHEVNRIVLWGGGAALVIAVLLTIGVLVSGSRNRQKRSRHKNTPGHEL